MICTCPAYPFPHREGGGDCGARWETVRDPYGTHDFWYKRIEMIENGKRPSKSTAQADRRRVRASLPDGAYRP
jgi:hypothetical protein